MGESAKPGPDPQPNYIRSTAQKCTLLVQIYLRIFIYTV
jgi:hypothetical protein